MCSSDPNPLSDAAIQAHRAVAVADSEPELSWLRRTLRAVKAQASLTVAIADIANVWPVEKVTAALSMLADRAVALSVAHLLKAAVARGEKPVAQTHRFQLLARVVAVEQIEYVEITHTFPLLSIGPSPISPKHHVEVMASPCLDHAPKSDKCDMNQA